MTDETERSGGFHGRRKGKALRAAQDQRRRDLLPGLRVPPGPLPDPVALFPRPVEAIHLEIGFGGGEHLAAAAAARPEIGFIGCEPFVNGVVKLLAAVEAGRLDNIRIWDEDASDLIAALPEGSVSRTYILFPDPWPKRRQRKRRFVSDRSLAALARIMPPGAELRFATDIDDYAGWVLARILRTPHFDWRARTAEEWRMPWPDRPGTRYEAKAAAAGRPASYLTFVRS